MFGSYPISKPQFACSGILYLTCTHPPIPGRPMAVRGSEEGRAGRASFAVFTVFTPKIEPDRLRRDN
jgi:hypothetical protein